MGKGWLIIIVILLIIGLFYYFKPEETKGVFKEIKDSVTDVVSNYSGNREINLGKLNLPCVNDSNCNSNIEKCESKCKCIYGNCIKNVPINSTI